MATIPNSNENRDLASAVTHRIRSDAMIVFAKSTLWWLVGASCIILSIGIGTGVAFFGYSYINDSRTSADRMAAAFADALKHASLDVRLSPDSTVKMEPGVVSLQPGGTVTGMVSLTPGATVSLAPGATVRATINAGEMPIPSQRQLNGAGSSYPVSNAQIVTDFTIFKQVKFDDAVVNTGWQFKNSEQTVPTAQYCYYIKSVDDSNFHGVSVKQDLGSNGYFNTAALGYKNINGREAAKSCIWFDGQMTRF
jgi:hypothetical protein